MTKGDKSAEDLDDGYKHRDMYAFLAYLCIVLRSTKTGERLMDLSSFHIIYDYDLPEDCEGQLSWELGADYRFELRLKPEAADNPWLLGKLFFDAAFQKYPRLLSKYEELYRLTQEDLVSMFSTLHLEDFERNGLRVLFDEAFGTH